jgi:hypothetical protein
LGPTLLALVVTCVRNRFVFSTPIHEYGDQAANSILTDQATRFQLLVGNYSRVGFHHPGPAFLYVQAAGQALFFRLFHLVPLPYNGQLLAVFALNAVLFGLVTLTLYRHLRSLPLVAVACGVMLLYLGHHIVLPSSWMPHLYFMPFLLFTVAAASVAAGELRTLPVYVLAGGLLVHGHVSFIEFVGVTTVVVAVAWTLPRRKTVRENLAAHSGALWLSTGILAVFLLPMVLDIVLHYPGQWGLYWRYARSNPGTHRTIGMDLRYMASFWARRPLSGALLGVVGAIALVLTLFERDSHRRRFFAFALGAVVLMSVLFFLYILRGVDVLDGYIGIFYMSIPLVVLILGATTTLSALSSRLVLQTAVALIAGAGLVVAGAVAPWIASPYRGSPDIQVQVAAVKQDPTRAGRPVALVFPHDAWPGAVGFVQEAHRTGLYACAVDPFWAFIFSQHYICSPQILQTAWKIDLDPTTTTPAPAGRKLWSGAVLWSYTDYELTVPPGS